MQDRRLTKRLSLKVQSELQASTDIEVPEEISTEPDRRTAASTCAHTSLRLTETCPADQF